MKRRQFLFCWSSFWCARSWCWERWAARPAWSWSRTPSAAPPRTRTHLGRNPPLGQSCSGVTIYSQTLKMSTNFPSSLYVSRYFIYALEYLASWSWNKREYFVHPSLYQLSLSPLGCQMWVYTQDAKCLKISNAGTVSVIILFTALLFVFLFGPMHNICHGLKL